MHLCLAPSTPTMHTHTPGSSRQFDAFGRKKVKKNARSRRRLPLHSPLAVWAPAPPCPPHNASWRYPPPSWKPPAAPCPQRRGAPSPPPAARRPSRSAPAAPMHTQPHPLREWHYPLPHAVPTPPPTPSHTLSPAPSVPSSIAFRPPTHSVTPPALPPTLSKHHPQQQVQGGQAAHPPRHKEGTPPAAAAAIVGEEAQLVKRPAQRARRRRHAAGDGGVEKGVLGRHVVVNLQGHLRPRTAGTQRIQIAPQKENRGGGGGKREGNTGEKAATRPQHTHTHTHTK